MRGNAYELGAAQAARAIAAGQLTALDLIDSCLERIEAVEPQVEAWSFVDPELARKQAAEADRYRQTGSDIGPLHGLPVGLKDIIDTIDMPTERGTPLYAGRLPGDDATVVRRLREAGAIIMGKTVTTEMAVFHPGKTRNPHNPAHTPGGSSSGSAAAVAAGMVPLAVGTQTNGSVIRPASFCGVIGYKPSFGLISRDRILMQSRLLDQVGVFGRHLEDVALLAECLMGEDRGDPDTRLRAPPQLRRRLAEEPPMRPRLALVKTPFWERAHADVHGGFAELGEALGDSISDYPLPAGFERIWDWHQCLMEADQAFYYSREYARGRDQLSARLREMIERGQGTSAVDYHRAQAARDAARVDLAEMFEDYDAIVMPAALGEAPEGLAATGDPVFCTLASFLGFPAITLPLLRGSRGLPIGVQLVGNGNDDSRLLRTARWLQAQLEPADGGSNTASAPT